MANPKRPRDPNQRAKQIVDIVTGKANDEPDKAPPPSMVERGRKGWQRGGPARALAGAHHFQCYNFARPHKSLKNPYPGHGCGGS